MSNISYHKTDPKTARVLFDDPVGNLERIQQSKSQGAPGSVFNDLANPKQPKSKVGQKPKLEKYVPSQQNDTNQPTQPSTNTEK
jgi:hypothetical protein